MKKYEYKTFIVNKTASGFFLLGGKTKDEDITPQLNKLGKEGWDLVSTTSTSQNHGATRHLLFIFKREI